MLASAAAPTFEVLLLLRLVLGAAIASAGPLVASLTGDLFEPAERGRIYGYILGGELLGAGFGLLVSGAVAAIWTWRASFVLLACLGMVLSWAIRRHLPEPARGGPSRLPVDATEIYGAGVREPPRRRRARRSSTASPPAETALRKEVRRQSIEPHAALVLHRDPATQPLRWAIGYVLSVRTNVVLIIASSLGYFFFSGLRTFAIVFAEARFDVGQGLASLLLIFIGAGTLAGILLAGRLSDALIVRHHVSARPVVGGCAFLVAAALFVPGLLSTSLLLAVPLLFLAAAGVGGANPPLDAARLDIMHSRLWGRAEGVRTVLRTALEAAAPLLFGYISLRLGGGSGGFGRPAGSQPHAALGLDRTLLLMLAPLVAAGVLLLVRARGTYPRDVATAAVSEQLTRDGDSR